MTDDDRALDAALASDFAHAPDAARAPRRPEATGCQFSIYPLTQADIHAPIQDAIAAASSSGLTVQVGRLSTFMEGPEDEVFMALRSAFAAARASGGTVMVATLTTGVPDDELVAHIQSTRVDAAPQASAAQQEEAPDESGSRQTKGQ
ncbi:MAG: Ykof family thiamine-binding protein [Actinobacteria bacterium]|nr:Ykof family thiamine-binding protein [Actinomycetota bacterium]